MEPVACPDASGDLGTRRGSTLASTQSSPARLAHAAVGVRDLDRAVWFYCDVLGFRLVGSTPHPRGSQPSKHRIYHLAGEGGRLDLLHLGDEAAPAKWDPDDTQVGFRHIGFKVQSVDGWAERLRSLGVVFRQEPTSARGGVKLAFFEDPDGANLEIVQGFVQYDKVWDEDAVVRERKLGVPAPGVARLDHVAITTPDLDSTIGFYRDVFGFRVLGQLLGDDPRGLKITYLSSMGAILEVLSFSAPTSPCPWQWGVPYRGLDHFGLAVDQIGPLQAVALAKGASLCYQRGGEAGRPWAMMTDPCGIPFALEQSN